MPVAVPTRHSGNRPPDLTKKEVCDANNEYHTNPSICWSKELCWWLLNEFSTTMGVFSPFSMPSDWSLEKFGESHATNPPHQKIAPYFQLPFMFYIFWSCYLLLHWDQWLQWSCKYDQRPHRYSPVCLIKSTFWVSWEHWNDRMTSGVEKTLRGIKWPGYY